MRSSFEKYLSWKYTLERGLFRPTGGKPCSDEHKNFMMAYYWYYKKVSNFMIISLGHSSQCTIIWNFAVCCNLKKSEKCTPYIDQKIFWFQKALIHVIRIVHTKFQVIWSFSLSAMPSTLNMEKQKKKVIRKKTRLKSIYILVL